MKDEQGRTSRDHKPKTGLCDAGLWLIIPSEVCPICGAPATGALCRAAYDKPAFEEWRSVKRSKAAERRCREPGFTMGRTNPGTDM